MTGLPRLDQQTEIRIGTDDCMVPAQMLAAASNAAWAPEGTAEQTAPHGSLVPAAWKVNWNVAAAAERSLLLFGKRRFCISGRESAKMTNGGTALYAVSASAESEAGGLMGSGSCACAAGRLPPIKDAANTMSISM